MEQTGLSNREHSSSRKVKGTVMSKSLHDKARKVFWFVITALAFGFIVEQMFFEEYPKTRIVQLDDGAFQVERKYSFLNWFEAGQEATLEKALKRFEFYKNNDLEEKAKKNKRVVRVVVSDRYKIGIDPLDFSSKPKPQPSIEEYAARLRKDMANVNIYSVSNRYEIWTTGGFLPGKWKDAGSLEEARKIVDDYYIEWAKNCIGPTPLGRKVE